MSASKTAEAAAKAVAKSKQTKAEDRTPEQIISAVRKNLAAGLAVTPDDQRFILTQLDNANNQLAQSQTTNTVNCEQIEQLNNQIAKLREENEQFRNVYEQENRTSRAKVEVIELPKVDSVTAGEAGFSVEIERKDSSDALLNSPETWTPTPAIEAQPGDAIQLSNGDVAVFEGEVTSGNSAESV